MSLHQLLVAGARETTDTSKPKAAGDLTFETYPLPGSSAARQARARARVHSVFQATSPQLVPDGGAASLLRTSHHSAS